MTFFFMQVLMVHPHPRLVRLLGYCNENENFCLVYEFMKGGSLENLLENEEKRKMLKAKQRISIALDVGILIFEVKHFLTITHSKWTLFLAYK